MYTRTTSIPYTKVTSIDYQTLPKKTLPGRLTWMIVAPENSGGELTYYIFSLEDAVEHLSGTEPSSILTIEK